MKVLTLLAFICLTTVSCAKSSDATTDLTDMESIEMTESTTNEVPTEESVDQMEAETLDTVAE